MEKVVYFLGAGFSAPLGLPVMTNFLTKSKDMYFQNQSRYARFPEVFNTIKRLSVSKNYYEADLFNIEEILSILEMRELLGEKAIKKENTQRRDDGLFEAGGPMEPPYPTLMNGQCPQEFPIKRPDGCYSS